MDLSLKQKRILELLAQNCRFANKDVAKQVGLSEDAVQYQIQKLIEDEKLGLPYIQFDYEMLGYRQYHVWITLREVNCDLTQLMKLDNVININTSFGKFDLQIIFIEKTQDDFQKKLEKLYEMLPIKEVSTARAEDAYKSINNVIPDLYVGTKIPINKKNKMYSVIGSVPLQFRGKFEIDDVDKKIIQELMKNPRGKYSEISKKTGINHETIRVRLNKYIESRFINHCSLLLNYKKFGLYTNYLLLKLNKIDELSFKEYLNRDNSIIYAAKLFGEYNCIFYLVTKDPYELGKKLKEIRTFLGDNIQKIDLLYLEEITKFVQFPTKLT
ncbi:MAG: AsnC family transcriptional regulator [Candidatus Woesearchaeota archaeon]|jgi:DNA-binding Lrp family transcriptional regulator